MKMNEEKKCNYCREYGAPLLWLTEDWAKLSVNIQGNELRLDDEANSHNDAYDSIQIEYCPMCGRKLYNDNI